MNWLEGFIASGHVIDLVIIVIAIEAVLLLAFRRKGVFPILLGLLPGLCLMLALRAALMGGGWQMIALWISASLPFHLADIRNRLRG